MWEARRPMALFVDRKDGHDKAEIQKIGRRVRTLDPWGHTE
jgi:hypothetical protein